MSRGGRISVDLPHDPTSILFAYGVLPLPEPLVESLHDALCRVRDPRGSNRVFHIGAMLTLLALGVMAGHKDLKPVVKHCG